MGRRKARAGDSAAGDHHPHFPVFSEYGNNFVKTMLRPAQTHETIRVVNDQRGCPTYAGDLAQAMIALAAEPEAAGIYHYCGDKAVSWYEFAQAIFSLRGSAPQLVPISSRNISPPRRVRATAHCSPPPTGSHSVAPTG